MLFGIILWFLVRKQRKRIWLPTVRILKLENRRLPRLRWRTPPWLAFLCFAVAALALAGLSLQPAQIVFTPYEPKELRHHLVFDLSPSVQQVGDLSQYISQAKNLIGGLTQRGRLTYASTHSPEVFEYTTDDELQNRLAGLGFHRAGVKLGQAIKSQLETVGDVDRLIVVSDGDLHSWNDFNWQYLTENMSVIFYDVRPEKRSQTENTYIVAADFLPGSNTTKAIDWDLTLARTGSGKAIGGSVVAIAGSQELARSTWQFAENAQRVNVRLSWSVSAGGSQSSQGRAGEPVLFRIETAEANTLNMDDEFRVVARGSRHQGILVAEPVSERLIEDGAHHLNSILNILGFEMSRVDYLQQPGPMPSTYPFWIILGGGHADWERTCPRSLETARLNRRKQQGAKSTERGMPIVWLVPSSLDADYEAMCRCYARLMTTREPNAVPAYCAESKSRDSWIGLLTSLGAKQVGGEVGEASQAIAYHQRDSESGMEVMAFTLPLVPSRQTGISHGRIPLLIRSLLQWQGLVSKTSGEANAGWPRIEDLVQETWRAALPPEQLAQIQMSNVPIGESLASPLASEQLPPRWTTKLQGQHREMPVKQDQTDPLPWIRWCGLILLTMVLLESLVSGAGLFSRWLRRAALIPLTVLTWPTDWAHAQAEMAINTVRYPSALASASFSKLAVEVSSRTSIELKKNASARSQIDDGALQDGWLWVGDSEHVADARGKLRGDVALWVKRGGMLILENIRSEERLARLTEDLSAAKEGGRWQAIPPDHELMRSFYLLDALPSCQDAIWRGFHHDGRLAILALPLRFLEGVADQPIIDPCVQAVGWERASRIFVNLLMVALTTDYKKDQIHLPEILKRLR